MSPHFDCSADSSAAGTSQRDVVNGPEHEALDDAAEALRETEVEAAQSETPAAVEESQLESMSIDELRKLAAALDVPDRAQIIDQDELIAAIRERM